MLRHQLLVLQVLPNKVHCEEEEDNDQDHRETLEDKSRLVVVEYDSEDSIAQENHDIANGDEEALSREIKHKE